MSFAILIQKPILKLKNLFGITVVLIGLLSIISCESIRTRSEITKAQKQEQNIPAALRPDHQKQEPSKSEQKSVAETPVIAPIQIEQGPIGPPVAVAPSPTEGGAKVGIVFGPGGMRSFAHIGVIRELVKNKIPIHSVSGIELGALVGGIFSLKGQMYDVEWQMMKLKEENFFKKGLMSTEKSQDISELSDFLQKAFPNSKIEDSKIYFSCPSYNLAKKQSYMISRGSMSSSLPLCLPYMPLFYPYNQTIAGMTSVGAIAKQLRARGANYLIYVDVLGENSGALFSSLDSSENLAWSMVAESIDAQMQTFNKVIRPNLSGFQLVDFAKRRDMVQRGQDATRPLIREIQKEIGM
jgi:NTE family protein